MPAHFHPIHHLLLAGCTLAVCGLCHADSAPPQLVGNTLIDTADLLHLAPSDTHPASPESWADRVRERYNGAGYPAVQVRHTTSTNGSPMLRIIEGRVAEVHIQGNHHHDDANIRTPLTEIALGESPNAQRLIKQIALSNENPSKQIGVTLEALPYPGEVKAKIDITDRRPQHFSVSYDNEGSHLLGRNRIYLGYQHANLFNRDHIVTALIGTSTDHPERNRIASLGYRLPLPNSTLSLDLQASHSESRTGQTSTPEGLASLTGQGTTLGTRLVQQLAPFGETKQKILYGIDYKSFDNQCTSNNTALSTDACGSLDSRPISLTYVNRRTTDTMDTHLVAAYLHNVAGGARGDRAYYERLNKTLHWQAVRLSASLEAALTHGWKGKLTLSGQYSNNHLIPGEQFGLGGSLNLRGYQERSVTGDRGYASTFELHTPAFAAPLFEKPVQTHALIFTDYGNVHDDGLGTHQTLSSMGIGVRTNVPDKVSIRIDLGRTLRPLVSNIPGAQRQAGDHFVHIKASYVF